MPKKPSLAHGRKKLTISNTDAPIFTFFAINMTSNQIDVCMYAT
jgi:hypothetical protein